MSDTMVDQVIDAIAHNPLSHAADEDTDAAVMPDFFEGPLRRLLLRQDSTPRLYLKALCVGGMLNFAGNMLIAGHALAVSRPAVSGCACSVDEREPESSDLAVLSAMGLLVPRGLNGLLMPYMGLQLAWSLHPTDGALAELGMGSAKVSQRVVASLTKWKY